MTKLTRTLVCLALITTLVSPLTPNDDYIRMEIAQLHFNQHFCQGCS